MTNEELVKIAANKYGFNLEFKTKYIFEKNGFTTKHSNLIRFQDELLEIDLIANKYVDRHFIVECKGTDSASCLILVEEACGQDNRWGTMSHKIVDTKCELIGYEPFNLLASFTGDFFNNNLKELKKASRSDDENNFYKAQLQISNAISSFSKNEQGFIVPLIVTNASLWMVNFNSPEKTEVTQFRWIIHKIKLEGFKLESREEESEVLSFFIPVVNIQYLDEFINIAQNFNINTKRIQTNSLPVETENA